MSLLAAVLLLWGLPLDPATDAASSMLRNTQGNQPLPRPCLSVEPVSWITPGLRTFLMCEAGLLNVAFLLRREGDDSFLEVAETDHILGAAEATAGNKEQAIFLVHQPGTYSCSYQTRTSDVPSAPSDTVTIKEYVVPPPPVLTSSGSSTGILPKMAHRTLVCEAPLADVEFQLRQGEQELNLPSISTSPEQIKFYLKLSDLGDQSPFTCRYRLHSNTAWSNDSEPVELMWSDETLPPPVLTAEPSNQIEYEPDSMVQFRCVAPKAGLRFGLHREDPGERSLLQTMKSAGREAIFQLHNVSASDSANYSCSYMELAPPFSGSAPSKFVTLTMNGPPPPPKLQALWTGKVPAGHDVALRCQSKVPGVTMELLCGGELVPYKILRMASTWSDLGLSDVGPQHSGNYTCRYTSWWPEHFHSALSNAVELLVDASVEPETEA